MEDTPGKILIQAANCLETRTFAICLAIVSFGQVHKTKQKRDGTIWVECFESDSDFSVIDCELHDAISLRLIGLCLSTVDRNE